MRQLLDDPDDTEKAIDFFYAIGRREFERNFQRFARSRSGQALLVERPSLAAAMSDRAALARMPEGSFGRAYLAFLERNGFAAMGLLELQKQVEAKWDAEEGVPRLDAGRRQELRPIEGQPRSMLSPPAWCPFAPRCPRRIEVCTEELPRLAELEPGQRAACFNPAPADAWRAVRLGGAA